VQSFAHVDFGLDWGAHGVGTRSNVRTVRPPFVVLLPRTIATSLPIPKVVMLRSCEVAFPSSEVDRLYFQGEKVASGAKVDLKLCCGETERLTKALGRS